MSWQLGAFALLAIALAAGFAWYERVRPDARIVALVGTLAAFAALGRIAFAAVPNVKPTTDIVLISGYALGGGPGFAVGALAGLTSNFFFGQGPWTPWQMAAWGATGVVGAALAWITSPRVRSALRFTRGARNARLDGGSGSAVRDSQPRIGRWPLAIVCCVVGFAFTVVQDVGDWVTYSDHSLVQLGAYVGQGLGFDAIHATGCLLFALALGPALTRSIQRFARRLQVTWVPSGAVVPLIAAVVLASALASGLRAPASARAATGVAGSVSYLLAAENSDGGFGPAPGQVSNELYSGWAALGLASAGYDPDRLGHGSRSLIDYIRAGAGSLSDVGSLERTILVVRAAGLSARSFAGRDLVAALDRHVLRDGSVADQVNLTSFAVLALRSAGVAPAARTFSWLVRQRDRDGGFSYAGAGSESDVDDTGAALEALAGGVGGAAVAARAGAVAYLRRQQDRDGGFPSQPGEGSNAQSTAWAVQGLDAAHVTPGALHRGGSVSPLAYLDGLIGSNGSISYSRGNDQTPVWVTAEALMALEGKPLPLAPTPAPAPARAVARTPASPAPARTRAVRRGRSSSSAVHRRTPVHARRGAARRSGTPASAPILGLAADIGLATALVLAPLGL
jgi:energy-coupling factor transport system substrate-specific component